MADVCNHKEHRFWDWWDSSGSRPFFFPEKMTKFQTNEPQATESTCGSFWVAHLESPGITKCSHLFHLAMKKFSSGTVRLQLRPLLQHLPTIGSGVEECWQIHHKTFEGTKHRGIVSYELIAASWILRMSEPSFRCISVSEKIGMSMGFPVMIWWMIDVFAMSISNQKGEHVRFLKSQKDEKGSVGDGLGEETRPLNRCRCLKAADYEQNTLCDTCRWLHTTSVWEICFFPPLEGQKTSKYIHYIYIYIQVHSYISIHIYTCCFF